MNDVSVCILIGVVMVAALVLYSKMHDEKLDSWNMMDTFAAMSILIFIFTLFIQTTLMGRAYDGLRELLYRATGR